MTTPQVDYFAPASTPEEAVLRRIKGEFRRSFIAEAIRTDGLASIPPQWIEHDLQELFKQMLAGSGPRRRGGEDLPDLDDGEVEIARVALVDSVHGEVTSLRAKRGPGSISLCLVDEYETEFDLPRESIDRPFTSVELIRFLAECSPSPLESECQLRISSPFHGDLQALLDEHLERSAD